ncbi:MAG TPA: hypothetical protein VF765_27380 [Polyangiaceae bacterium]
MTSAVHASIPTPVSMSGYDGEISALYATESQHRQSDLQAGKTRVQGEEKAEQKACEKAHEAIERAEEAESHQGFWSDIEDGLGDIAKVAGAVAAAASAIASGGAAVAVLAPVAAAASTTAGVGELAAAGAGVVRTRYTADTDQASADAEEATLLTGRLQDGVDSTLDDVRDADESHRSVEQTLQGTIQIKDRTSVDTAASLRIRG